MTRATDLCIFVSTKPRWGRLDYKITIDSFFEQAIGFPFENIYVNLKTFAGDEETADEIKAFCRETMIDGRNPVIINEIKGGKMDEADRDNNRALFIGEILHDICSFVLKYKDRLSPYLFFLEDDSPIVCKTPFGRLAVNALGALDCNRNLASVHFPRLSLNYQPCSPSEYYAYHKFKRWGGYIRDGYFFNFQPRFLKKSDLLSACEAVAMNWPFFASAHPEDGIWAGYKIVNPDVEFWALAPETAYSIHLGEEPKYHDLVLQSEPWLQKCYGTAV